MFGLFKKNKTYPAFAPLGVDIHCHLLPQVDDGSRSLEESLEVMCAMKEVGFESIMLTPHFSHRYTNTEEDIATRYNNFLAEVDPYRSTKDLPEIAALGGEYQLDDRFRDRAPQGGMNVVRYSNDTDEGKGIILLEFSLHQPILGAVEELFKLQMEGYEIILAHPERYPYLDSHSHMLEQLKEQGVLFQSNILSFDGFYGEAAQKKAFDYVSFGWIDFLGTDMHNVMYANALRHASTNKKLIQLIEKEHFENSRFIDNKRDKT